MVANLTVDDLRKMITEIVRQVVREETRRDYYINADGFKVLYEEEPIDPDYLREINAEYKAIREGRSKVVSADESKEQLRRLGASV
jgi:tRNA A37 threonylcarbamoyladenosine dehydratase